MPKRLLASIYGFLFFAALALRPTPAAAQTVTAGTITINTGSQATELVDINHNPVSHSYQPATSQLYWVNLAECKLNWVYQISVTTLNIGTQVMEVWAGINSADCTQTLERYTQGSQQCWPVATVQVNDGTNAVYVPVVNVVGEHFLNAEVTTTVTQGTTADCDTIANSGIPEAGVPITLNFYIFAGGYAGAPTYSASWTGAGYDLIGPSPPTSVSLQPADTELYVNWPQVVVTDLAGYNIYCQDLSKIDGGLALLQSYDAGLTDAGTIACPATITQLIPGCLPPDGLSPSGSVTSTLATSGIAAGLTNGDNYACAVSCIDTMENNGPLSQFQAGTPWYVDDFFSNYRRAGGLAGGGFCSIGHLRYSAIALVIPLAGVVLLALRRRRSKP